MKTKCLLFLFLFFSFLLPKNVSAFTDNFNVAIEEESIVRNVNPGHSYSLSLTLHTSTNSLTVYPVSLDISGSASFSAISTWVSFPSSSLNLHSHEDNQLHFTVTIPNNTPTGEYTKVIGVSDQPFENSESDNPPTILGIPLVLQVTNEAITPTPTQAPSTNNESSNTSTSQSSSQTGNTQTSVTVTKAPTKPSKTPTKPPIKLSDIYSDIQLISFTTKYDFLKQRQIVTVKIRNNGNATAFLSGGVTIKNSKDKILHLLKIFANNEPIRPKETKTYTSYFSVKDFLLGTFSANLYLGYHNSKTSFEPQLIRQTTFFHLSRQPLFITVASTFLLTFIASQKPQKKHRRLKYLAMMLITFVGSITLLIGFLNGERADKKWLGTQSDLSVTANIKEIISIKTSSSMIHGLPQYTIHFTNQNPLGATLYSLRGNSRIQLGQITTHTAPTTSITISGASARFPLLMMTKDF